MRWQHAAVTVLSLLSLSSNAAFAQDSTREQLLQEAVELLREELTSKNELIDSLQRDNADMQARIALLEEVQRQKDAQIALHENNSNLLTRTVDSQQEWITALEESISQRDAAIQTLAEDTRPSALVRLVESLPAVAAILAGLAK